jgi:uncharacterized protein (DUF2236 family)
MSDVGLFGPGSVTWRVNRESVLLLGGGRALILQVAHPLIAAGVSEHSNYREDPWGRLRRTLDLTTRIVFGDAETAAEASARLRRVHTRVVGVTSEPGGRFPAGTPYAASDPDLLMWVHATLLDTALLVYDGCVRPVSIAERRRYYQEQRRLAEAYGIPRARQPETYEEFNEYVAGMLESDSLAATDSLRDVADALLRPRVPVAMRPFVETLGLATIGMLPARLREELGLPWGPKRERLLALSRAALRHGSPLLPSRWREFPRGPYSLSAESSPGATTPDS